MKIIASVSIEIKLDDTELLEKNANEYDCKIYHSTKHAKKYFQ